MTKSPPHLSVAESYRKPLSKPGTDLWISVVVTEIDAEQRTYVSTALRDHLFTKTWTRPSSSRI